MNGNNFTVGVQFTNQRTTVKTRENRIITLISEAKSEMTVERRSRRVLNRDVEFCTSTRSKFINEENTILAIDRRTLAFTFTNIFAHDALFAHFLLEHLTEIPARLAALDVRGGDARVNL